MAPQPDALPDRLPPEAAADRGSGRIQRRQPSLLRYAPEAIIIMIATAASLRQADPDLWGHIRFGQAMLAQRHLTLHDPYSYSAFGHRWRNHEWLSEVIMAGLYNHFGVIGLKLWKFACSAAAIVLLALAADYTDASPKVQLYLVGIAAAALTPYMQFRPQLFTFVLFAALMALLARHSYRGSAPLWLAVPIMALWANLHGGFVIGIVALALYASTTLLEEWSAGWPKTSALGLVWLALGAALATLLTPYFGGTWAAVLHALDNPATRKVIDDWQPFSLFVRHAGHLEFSYTFFRLFALAIIGAMVVAVIITPRDHDRPLIVIGWVMSIGALVAIRNVPLAVIACVAPAARHLTLLQLRFEPRPQAASERLFSGRVRWLVTALALVLAVSTSRLFSSRLYPDVACPAGAIAFMKEHGLHGNLLNEFGWGECLIWHVAPSSKVFIDGRYDTVYPGRAIEDYFNFQDGGAPAAEVLHSYPHDFVLFPADSMTYSLMSASAGWKLIYRDRNSALFARKDSAAARLSGVPVISTAASSPYFP